MPDNARLTSILGSDLSVWWTHEHLSKRWHAALQAAVTGESRPYFFLQICLVLMALSAGVFHAFPVASHDTRINLLLGAVLLVLAWFAGRPRCFLPVLHAALLASVCLVLFIASLTGGIHSQVMLWVCLAPLVALLLAGAWHGLAWLVLVQLLLLAMWRLTVAGLVPSHVPKGPTEVWVLSGNLVMCVLVSFLVVAVYDALHRRRLAALEEGNRASHETHAALVMAQAHKDEFVAAVGHELRTPMSAILGLNAILRDQLAHSPDQLEAVDHIRRSTRQLLAVVNNILDFSQLQAGQLQLHPDWVDVRAVLAEVMDQQRNRAEAKGMVLALDVDPDVPAQVHIDHQRLRQVLVNLLDNAWRYSPDGAPVRVSVAVRDGQLHVEVQDHGPGIESGQQEQIFSLFVLDADRHRRNNEGTGLGLSICQQLVSLAGGRIGVISSPGQGACFWFDWPLSGPESVAAAPPAQPGTLPALDVLVVDDDAVNRMVAALQIRKALPQCRVDTVGDAQQAQKHLMERPCDVVVLDMYMPGMSGLDLARWVREQPAGLQNITLIGLTASTYPQDWERCIQAGMDGVLTKPLEPARIVQMLTRTPSPDRGGRA